MKYQTPILRNAQGAPRVYLALGMLAVLTMLGLQAPVQGQIVTNIWNGGGSGNYWSTAGNWNGVPLASGNNITFNGTTKQVNTNDISGLILANGNITFSNSGFVIFGNQITITNTKLFSVTTGSNVWAADINLGTSSSANLIFGNGASGPSTTFNMLGAISGAGYLSASPSASGNPNIYLSNTNNSFTGRLQTICGNLYIYSLAPGGVNSSLGAGSATTGTIGIGSTGTTKVAQSSLTFLGSQNGVTDRPLSLQNGTNGTVSLINNSPNNSGLSFNGLVDVLGTGTMPMTVAFGGTSTATNNVSGQIGANYSGNNLSIVGPGTWSLNNVILLTNGLTVATNSHLVLGYTNAYPNSTILFNTLSLNPGSTLDLSSYDQNGSTFVLGNYSGYPQTMTVGHVTGTATDISGSLSLSPVSLGLPGNASLNAAGTGVAGTLNISGNLTLGTGTLLIDVGSSPSTGNDVINVSGNLDLSQGPAALELTVIGSVQTGVPYTLINYSGSLIGSGAGLTVQVGSPAVSATVVDPATTPGKIQVTFASTGLPNYLLWAGSVNGNWDVATTPNWLAGATPFDFTNYYNVVFDDSSAQTNVNLTGPLSPFSVTFSNSANSYALSGNGGLANGSLVKTGSGTLLISSTNTYTGGTTITAGTIQLGNPNALGTGTVTLNGGTLNVSNNSFANTIILNSTVNTILANGSYRTLGPITGTGGFILDGTNTPGVTINNAGNNFQGNITINPGAFLRTDTSEVIPHSVIITNYGGLRLSENGTETISGLFGGTASEIIVVSSVANTLIVGANNVSSSYAGAMVPTNQPQKTLSLAKIGSGVFTITGSNNTYTGSTIVSNGTLVVDGSICATNGSTSFSTVSVLTGATLGGSGLIGGPVTNLAGSSLAPGDSGQTGILTLTNGLGINGANLLFTLTNASAAGAAYDQLNIAGGAFVANGNNIIQLVAGAGSIANGTYILITNSVAKSGSGTFVFTNGSTTLGNYQLTAGPNSVVLTVAGSAPTQPATITGVNVSGGKLIITGTNMNGGSNFHYVVLSSTNLAAPLANWKVLSTNAFNANGTFSYTNVISGAGAAAFFDTVAVP